MNESRLDELMNQELDGCNTPEESRALDEHLRGDPEAQRRYQQLEEAVATLANWDLEEPPAELRASILEAMVQGIHPEPVGQEPQVTFGGPFRGLARSVMLVPLAAGLVAGLLVSNLMMRGTADTNGLGGTAGAEWQDLAPEGLVPLDLSDVSATGELWVGSRGDRTGVRLSLDTAAPLEISMEMGPATVCRGYHLGGGARPTLRITRRAVVLEGATTGEYEFVFGHAGDTASEIRLKIIHEGRIVAETLVRSGQDR